MATEFVAPIRYEKEEAPAPIEKPIYGFKRWVAVMLVFGASFYTHNIGAIIYSSMLFLIAMGLIMLMLLYTAIRRPRVIVPESEKLKHKREMALIQKWGK